MTTYTLADVDRLAEAENEIKELKKFIGARANIFHYMKTGVDPELYDHNGFYVQMPNYEIFDPKCDVIRVKLVDGQYGGGSDYPTPRAFIFGKETEEEKEFAVYLAVKNKLPKPRY